MLKKILSGISAGLAICMGGAVFLACESRYAGAALFSVALTCICCKGYSLFTGRVGYLAETCTKESVSALLLGLLGNAVATLAGGFLIARAMPALGTRAAEICASKLEQGAFSCFVRGCCCGVLMYLAVSIYKEKHTLLGVLLCIPAFILSGFEHSIADMFYFAASGIASVKAFGYIWLVILGNSVGALILPLISRGETQPS